VPEKVVRRNEFGQLCVATVSRATGEDHCGFGSGEGPIRYLHQLNINGHRNALGLCSLWPMRG
jgi:hypothetical protein